MKQRLSLELPETPLSVKRYISLWREKKHYPQHSDITIGECLELLIATSYNLHKDYSDGKFYNNVLLNDESAVSWDGDEFIDILFYEVVQNIKKRLSVARVFEE